jgi:hypothetical protein
LIFKGFDLKLREKGFFIGKVEFCYLFGLEKVLGSKF